MTFLKRIQTHWDKIEIFLKEEWPRLSDTSINNINGDYDKFLKYLEENYDNFPLEEAKARDKLQRFLNTLDEPEV